MTRRLAAIMFTDIAGYTAMAQADEAGALALVKEQERLIRRLLAVHQGRKVKSTGDGFLLEFENALDAVECAAELQRQIHERNASEGAQPLRIRVGIHLGDVQRQGTDIYGDAVNIASRIEPLAEVGGVCLSEPVFVQVRNKVPYRLENVGRRTLKGVQEPMEIYRVVLPWLVPALPQSVTSIPRIAILPLANISPDPNDEYLADGLTEELISVLSQNPGLRMISHTSVNQYKHATKPVAQIGAELGVDSVLEGSVRRSGDQLRISVQLIDTRTDEHRWAQTYDRKLENVFAIQADVAEQTARALRIELLKPVADRLKARSMVNPESYLAYLKGRNMLLSRSEGNLRGAKEQFERAIELDPSNSGAYSGLSDAIRLLGYYQYETAEAFEQRKLLAERALGLDSSIAEAHASLGDVRRSETDFAGAEEEFRVAVSINPSYSTAHHWYGLLLMDLGRTEEALKEFTLAIEANPLAPISIYMRAQLLLCLGRDSEAERDVARLAEIEPDSRMYHWACQCRDEAKRDTTGILRELDWELRSNPDQLTRLHDEVQRFLLTGERDKALITLEKIKEISCGPGPKAKSLAVLSAYAGNLDDCFHWIDELIRLHSLELLIWRLQPWFANVRADPRYGALLKRLRAE